MFQTFLSSQSLIVFPFTSWCFSLLDLTVRVDERFIPGYGHCISIWESLLFASIQDMSPCLKISNYR